MDRDDLHTPSRKPTSHHGMADRKPIRYQPIDFSGM